MGLGETLIVPLLLVLSYRRLVLWNGSAAHPKAGARTVEPEDLFGSLLSLRVLHGRMEFAMMVGLVRAADLTRSSSVLRRMSCATLQHLQVKGRWLGGVSYHLLDWACSANPLHRYD